MSKNLIARWNDKPKGSFFMLSTDITCVPFLLLGVLFAVVYFFGIGLLNEGVEGD
ncbi:MAG: hypothetical protein FWD97_04970 [Defluviitaleaceae bacterium]|nr:hypothetical protein [Defluviitaleaceae bacterium]